MIHRRIIPPLPEYDPINIIDECLGTPEEDVSYNEGNYTLETYRCPTCGALQWAGVWRKDRKTRCQRCKGLLEFDNKDIFLADWNDYWFHTPYYDEPYLTYDKSEFSDKISGIVSIPSTFQVNVGENKYYQVSIIGVPGIFEKNINMTKNCYFEIEDGYEDKILINNDGLISINEIHKPCQIEIYARYNSFIDTIKVMVN